jgi:hypothetical protein
MILARQFSSQHTWLDADQKSQHRTTHNSTCTSILLSSGELKALVARQQRFLPKDDFITYTNLTCPSVRHQFVSEWLRNSIREDAMLATPSSITKTQHPPTLALTHIVSASFCYLDRFAPVSYLPSKTGSLATDVIPY